MGDELVPPICGTLTIKAVDMKGLAKAVRTACQNIKTAFKPKTRVMFNPPATILWVGDKKYVSKAHNEEFDEEKGLLMCLAKANGISHLELQRMLKNAERPTEKKTNKEN